MQSQHIETVKTIENTRIINIIIVKVILLIYSCINIYYVFLLFLLFIGVVMAKCIDIIFLDVLQYGESQNQHEKFWLFIHFHQMAFSLIFGPCHWTKK